MLIGIVAIVLAAAGQAWVALPPPPLREHVTSLFGNPVHHQVITRHTVASFATDSHTAPDPVDTIDQYSEPASRRCDSTSAFVWTVPTRGGISPSPSWCRGGLIFKAIFFDRSYGKDQQFAGLEIVLESNIAIGEVVSLDVAYRFHHRHDRRLDAYIVPTAVGPLTWQKRTLVFSDLVTTKQLHGGAFLHPVYGTLKLSIDITSAVRMPRPMTLERMDEEVQLRPNGYAFNWVLRRASAATSRFIERSSPLFACGAALRLRLGRLKGHPTYMPDAIFLVPQLAEENVGFVAIELNFSACIIHVRDTTHSLCYRSEVFLQSDGSLLSTDRVQPLLTATQYEHDAGYRGLDDDELKVVAYFHGIRALTHEQAWAEVERRRVSATAEPISAAHGFRLGGGDEVLIVALLVMVVVPACARRVSTTRVNMPASKAVKTSRGARRRSERREAARLVLVPPIPEPTVDAVPEQPVEPVHEPMPKPPVNAMPEPMPQPPVEAVPGPTPEPKVETVDNSCVVCMEAERCMLNPACGHLCCCSCCSLFCLNCPICRAPSETWVLVRNV
jgi:hypothetical protein